MDYCVKQIRRGLAETLEGVRETVADLRAVRAQLVEAGAPPSSELEAAIARVRCAERWLGRLAWLCGGP